MISAWFRVVVVLLVLLGATAGVAGVSIAQVSETKGTVQRVDASSGMMYFTDGRTMKLEPSSRIYVGNREVRLSDVEPGWILVTSGPSVTPGSMLVQSATAAPALAPADRHRRDRHRGQRGCADGHGDDAGRTGHAGDSWQHGLAARDDRLRHARRLGVRSQRRAARFPAHGGPDGSSDRAPGGQPALPDGDRFGTSDSSSSQIVLSDGTVVQMRPGGRVTLNGQSDGDDGSAAR